MIFLPLAVRHGFVEIFMRILVTGASGYIGSRFARYMQSKRPQVELLLASRSGRCEWLEGLGRQVPLELGGTEPLVIPDSIDAVVHLAAANEIECVDVKKALQINVNGTWRLIEELAARSVKKFIYGSTIHVYGELSGRLTESSGVAIKHPYGFTHQMAEQLFEYASQRYGIEVKCLRFSNVIGAPADSRVSRWSLLVNDLCRQAIQKNRLEIRMPESRRDFLAMADACSSIEWALMNSSGCSGFDVFNIASGHCMTVLAMAELIATRANILLHKDVSVVLSGVERASGAANFVIDNSKALHWKWCPADDLISEIDSTLELCKENARV